LAVIGGYWRLLAVIGGYWRLLSQLVNGPMDRERWSTIIAQRTNAIGQMKNTNTAIAKMVISLSIDIGQAFLNWSMDRLVSGPMDQNGRLHYGKACDTLDSFLTTGDWSDGTTK
jgi:hypothetical protein